MIYEKSPGSVWNVALVAIVILLGAMAVSAFVSSGEKTEIASAVPSN